MGVKLFKSDWAVREYSISGKLNLEFASRWPSGPLPERYSASQDFYELDLMG